MTRQPHDQFAKQYLEELLSPLGTVEVSREITDETRQVDILFSPHAAPNTAPESLGLLGRIATTTVLIEPFRNAPTKTEIRNCLLKLFSVFAELQRKAKRENTPLTEDNLPRLWILATSASAPLLESFGAKLDVENWPSGVYLFHESFRSGIIAINQLPVTPDTLWLRLLGRGETQRQAVRELLSLPNTDLLRRNVQELLVSWRVSVEIQNLVNQENQELIMNLSQAYLEWKAATLEEGRQEGQQEGQRLILENLLQAKFGQLDPSLRRVVDALVQLPPSESSRLLLTLSREELVSRFAQENE